MFYRIFSIVLFFWGVLGMFILVNATPLKEVDLASDTKWQLRVDAGAYRSIKVPAGGFNSDMQDKPYINMSIEGNGFKNDVEAHVEYKREIAIPNVCQGQVTRLEFGSVNHGCEVYLNDKKVGEHHGPNMPFVIDVTDEVTPGNSYELRVKVYPGKYHYGNYMPMGYYYTEYYDDRVCWNWKGWTTKHGFGITKYIKIAVYPEIYIKERFVRPSVTNKTLSYDLWIYNHSNTGKTISLEGKLTSWNNRNWVYPTIPSKSITISADSKKKVTIGPIKWELGSESYWWPNKPFRENYVTQLHYLHIKAKNNNTLLDSLTQRFGFVEWGEGPFYYTVNGLRVNHISDATPEPNFTHYSAYSQSPAFLPPTGSKTGCPETWKRYMRMNINTNRIHQATPTQYMLDCADEVGFMLIPETGIRGGGHRQIYHDTYMPLQCTDLAYVCRNHPSVCRYSLSNEWGADSRLIDDIVTVDNTKPLVFEFVIRDGTTKVTGASGYHAYSMGHYQGYPKPATIIWGLGEYETGPNGFEPYCWKGTDMRYYDIAYFAGWCFCNYWPNFLEGMNRELYAYKATTFTDRVDGTGANANGWGSPLVVWMQQNFHPYLVLDWGLHNMNKYDRDGETFYGKLWPDSTSSYPPGSIIKRELIIFNDGYLAFKNDTNDFKLTYDAHWDSPTGQTVINGIIDNIKIKAGFHTKRTITLIPPSENNHTVPIKKCHGDTEVFDEERIFFYVGNRKLYVVLRLYLKDNMSGITKKTIQKEQFRPDFSLFKIVNGQFTIPVEKIKNIKNAKINVYDLRGRVLCQSITNNLTTLVKKKHFLAKGIYIVKVNHNKK